MVDFSSLASVGRFELGDHNSCIEQSRFRLIN
jgi:hypothetical protein